MGSLRQGAIQTTTTRRGVRSKGRDKDTSHENRDEDTQRKLNGSVLERRKQRGSRTEGKRESSLQTKSLGPDVPTACCFFFNNVLLGNSHTIIIYILSTAAIMV